MDLSQRSPDIEIMDDLSCSGEVVHQTLRELDVINTWLGGNAVTLEGAKRMLPPSGHHMRVADLGCGSGDMLRRLSRLARARGIRAELTGIDANPHIIEFARAHSQDFADIQFEAINIFSEDFKKRDFDLIIATLFFHHFSNEQLINLFRQLKKQAKAGIIVNDIHRHALAYYSIKWLTHLFSKSAMVRFDAPLSVRRSFTRAELEYVMEQAGITTYELRWKWAFRWQLIIRTPG